ncbi:MAG TPA: AtpZ/AtpI family protein [Acidimicrobiales bacterium]
MSEARDADGAHRPDQEKVPLRDLPSFGAFAAMGTSIALIEALGVLLGLYLDHLWRAEPWGLLLGIVLATVVAAFSVIQLIRRYL